MEDYYLLQSISKSSSKKHNEHENVTYLTNSDFVNGTYRIQKPGIYRLQENIVFHPNPNNDFFPNPNDPNYPMRGGPYILGFFAAITIESDDVVLDLNNYSISQSKVFYLVQRFFNLVELASSPFIPKQGPGNFGPKIKSASRVTIKNGTFGLSSHNAIHGNSNNHIRIENITIEDFEVGGISLNDGDDIEISNTVIQNSIGTKLKVPVNGRFSSLVFLNRQYQRIKDDETYSIETGDKRVQIVDIKKNIQDLYRQTIHEFMRSDMSSVPKFSDNVYSQFGNPDGFPDGSAIYGILFNKRGIAVNELGCCNKVTNHNETDNSKKIKIKHTVIQNIVLKPREVVGLLKNNTKKEIQNDFSGSVILIGKKNWFSGLNVFDPYKPFYDTLNNFDYMLLAQVALYKYSIDTDNKSFKGVANIDNDIIHYVKSGKKSLMDINPNFKTVRNTDIMAHVMKGAIGIRLDFSSNVEIENVKINSIFNYGNKGIETTLLTKYVDGKIGNNLNHLGHPKSSNEDKGYAANFCRGVSVIESKDISIKNNKITNLSSLNGQCIGIDINKNSLKLNIVDNIIQYLFSCISKTVNKCKSIDISYPETK